MTPLPNLKRQSLEGIKRSRQNRPHDAAAYRANWRKNPDDLSPLDIDEKEKLYQLKDRL